MEVHPPPYRRQTIPAKVSAVPCQIESNEPQEGGSALETIALTAKRAALQSMEIAHITVGHATATGRDATRGESIS